MELIKELPEVFEEFAEQRQKSFMAMKGLKDQGVPVVGAYCTYFPAEIARAMGAVTVGLCSVSDETIPDAEKDLPKNLCPLIKSSYGFAKTDKCPFFYFSDMVLAETTCDGKKKMYELMGRIKPTHVMLLPHNPSLKASEELWLSEIYRAKEVLDIELAGYHIFSHLIDTLTEAVMNQDHAYSKLLLQRIPEQYDTNASTVYGKVQCVLDYISGMTDVYALDLYRKITGMSLPAV